MQKFVVRKSTRTSPIMTIKEEESCDPSQIRKCVNDKYNEMKREFSASDSQLAQSPKCNKSVKMCGYLKKKRNKVGGWNKLYFVLQNNLLLSYTSKEDYELKLKPFKDVISLIPGNTIILPTLGPRFTLETNLNTFYTFRCDDNKTCSMWISAIMECLAKESETNNNNNKKILRSPKNYYSCENINFKPQFLRQSSLSWEALNTTDVNGQIIIGLNYLNSGRYARLPIAQGTRRILERGGLEDLIKSRHIERIEEIKIKDENHNNIKKIEVHQESDEHLKEIQKQKHNFRLHDHSQETLNFCQSKDVNRINRIFIGNMSDTETFNCDSSSSNTTDSMFNIEEQVQMMSLGEESLIDDSIIDEYLKKSIDPRIFRNTLTIEEYPSIHQDQPDSHTNSEPLYATVNLKSKHEGRQEKKRHQEEKEDEEINKNISTEYEDIDDPEEKHQPDFLKHENDTENIYELVELPTRSKSVLWRTWKRINFDALLDFSKRTTHEPIKRPPEIVNKRQKSSLTFSEFSKRFSSMRNRARKIYRNPLPTFSRTDDVKEEAHQQQETKSQ